MRKKIVKLFSIKSISLNNFIKKYISNSIEKINDNELVKDCTKLLKHYHDKLVKYARDKKFIKFKKKLNEYNKTINEKYKPELPNDIDSNLEYKFYPEDYKTLSKKENLNETEEKRARRIIFTLAYCNEVFKFLEETKNSIKRYLEMYEKLESYASDKNLKTFEKMRTKYLKFRKGGQNDKSSDLAKIVFDYGGQRLIYALRNPQEDEFTTWSGEKYDDAIPENNKINNNLTYEKYILKIYGCKKISKLGTEVVEKMKNFKDKLKKDVDNIAKEYNNIYDMSEKKFNEYCNEVCKVLKTGLDEVQRKTQEYEKLYDAAESFPETNAKFGEVNNYFNKLSLKEKCKYIDYKCENLEDLKNLSNIYAKDLEDKIGSDRNGIIGMCKTIRGNVLKEFSQAQEGRNYYSIYETYKQCVGVNNNVVINNALTEFKKAEEKLEKFTKKWETIVNNMYSKMNQKSIKPKDSVQKKPENYSVSKKVEERISQLRSSAGNKIPKYKSKSLASIPAGNTKAKREMLFKANRGIFATPYSEGKNKS